MSKEETEAYVKSLMGGYKEEDLQAAFNEVKDQNDWKAAIDTVVVDKTDEELALIKFAVRFYTATECKLTELDMTGAKEACDNNVRRATKVKAVGYRMGPAGP